MEKKLEVELETIVMPAANLLDPTAISRMLEIKCACDTGVFSQYDFGEVWWRKARLNLVVHIRDVYLVDGSTWSCFFENMWRILNTRRHLFLWKAFDANNIAMHVLECLAILDAVWIQDMCYYKFIFRDMPLSTDLKYIDLGQMSEAARPKLQLMLLNATCRAGDPCSLGFFAKFGPVFAQQSYADLASGPSGLVIAEEFVSLVTDVCCLALQHEVRFGWGSYMQGYRGSDPRMEICRVVKWLPAGSSRNRCITRLARALDFYLVPSQDRHILPKAVLRRLSPRDLSRVAKVFLNSSRRIRQVQLENGRLSSCRQAWIAAVLV